MSYTEDHLVEQPTIQFFVEMSWVMVMYAQPRDLPLQRLLSRQVKSYA